MEPDSVNSNLQPLALFTVHASAILLAISIVACFLAKSSYHPPTHHTRRRDKQHLRHIALFSFLTALSFLMTVYHAIIWRAASYMAWAHAHSVNISKWSGWITQETGGWQLGRWIQAVDLRAEADEALFGTSKAIWWTYQQLVGIVTWSIFVGIEGELITCQLRRKTNRKYRPSSQNPHHRNIVLHRARSTCWTQHRPKSVLSYHVRLPRAAWGFERAHHTSLQCFSHSSPALERNDILRSILTNTHTVAHDLSTNLLYHPPSPLSTRSTEYSRQRNHTRRHSRRTRQLHPDLPPTLLVLTQPKLLPRPRRSPVHHTLPIPSNISANPRPYFNATQTSLHSPHLHPQPPIRKPHLGQHILGRPSQHIIPLPLVFQPCTNQHVG